MKLSKRGLLPAILAGVAAAVGWIGRAKAEVKTPDISKRWIVLRHAQDGSAFIETHLKPPLTIIRTR